MDHTLEINDSTEDKMFIIGSMKTYEEIQVIAKYYESQ